MEAQLRAQANEHENANEEGWDEYVEAYFEAPEDEWDEANFEEYLAQF